MKLKIIELGKDGLNATNISECLEIPVRQVFYTLSEYKKNSGYVFNKKKKNIIELHKQGYTSKHISENLNLKLRYVQNTITEFRKEYGTRT